MAPKTATRTAGQAGEAPPSRPRSAPPRSKTRKPKAAPPKFKSRAVLRLIEAGNGAFCEHCDEQVKFKARERLQQVICNVYVKGVWNRVEHYHADCYRKAGAPYGTPAPPEPRRTPASRSLSRLSYASSRRTRNAAMA